MHAMETNQKDNVSDEPIECFCSAAAASRGGTEANPDRVAASLIPAYSKLSKSYLNYYRFLYAYKP